MSKSHESIWNNMDISDTPLSYSHIQHTPSIAELQEGWEGRVGDQPCNRRSGERPHPQAVRGGLDEPEELVGEPDRQTEGSGGQQGCVSD